MLVFSLCFEMILTDVVFSVNSVSEEESIFIGFPLKKM